MHFITINYEWQSVKLDSYAEDSGSITVVEYLKNRVYWIRI